MAARRLKNEWAKRKPKPSEIATAQRLARKVDRKLFEMMEANAA